MGVAQAQKGISSKNRQSEHFFRSKYYKMPRIKCDLASGKFRENAKQRFCWVFFDKKTHKFVKKSIVRSHNFFYT